ncbi:MAG: VWA domain-containing protein [Bacteroidales bacterium]|nr:MAG: VWA domain-containing protein [Bacteroidales bacterium]
MSQFEFAHPKYFYLLLLLIPVIAWYIWKENKLHATIRVSTIQPLLDARKSLKNYLRHLLFVIRLIIVILLIIVLARPQSTRSWEQSITEGIDIIIALDISGSMLARDFKPDRLEASKDIAVEFISGRRNDRMGLVVFSGESFTQCPLTTDHKVLINLFNDIKSGMIEDGTAIGVGLGNAVKRLKDSDAISKVIILLTDGVNNQGSIDPLTAAEIAKTFGIRVYTIGVGSMGTAPYPVQHPFTGNIFYQDVPVEIDEEMLQEIADITAGKYFRATNNEKLREIYGIIDKLEKSKIDIKEYSKKQEKYLLFATAAALLLLGEILLKNTVLKNIP